MLTAIREKATGWIAWAIVFLISIPFALWGINSYFEGGEEISVATVNGEEISLYDYQEQLAAQRQLLSNRLGGNIDPELLEALGIRQQVLDGLVDNRLLGRYAEDQNYRISNNQLMSLIQSVPAFQQDGKFDQSLYNDVLAANRLTPQGFEQSQRASGVVDQLANGLDQTAFVTSVELDRILLLLGQKRIVKYAQIDANKYVQEFEATEGEIQSYYESNLASFQNDASMKVDYIELSIDALSETVSPSEEDIQLHFEETRGRYKTAESRKASHILIAAGDSLSEEETQLKLDRAMDVAERAKNGEDFGELALEFSDDPGSSINGGDLGIVARGQMVKPFEDAVFSMGEGDISDPIQTTFGYHIIKLTSIDEGREQTLDEVRDQVEVDVRAFQAEELFAELAESFRNLVFESPDSIQVSADELDLPVLSSDWFTEQAGEGVVSDYQVRQAAFGEEVLNEGLVSQAIEIGFDKLIAVQKSDFKEAHAKPLDEVREEIVSAIRLERSQARVLEIGSTILQELESSAETPDAWNNFLETNKLEEISLPESRREITADLITLGESVYSLSPPEPGKIKVGGMALISGDYVIYALQEVISGNLENTDESERNRVTQQLLARDGQEFYDQFRAGLRESAEIVVFEEQL